jgi:uncharacterized protein (TIGR03435 family)
MEPSRDGRTVSFEAISTAVPNGGRGTSNRSSRNEFLHQETTLKFAKSFFPLVAGALACLTVLPLGAQTLTPTPNPNTPKAGTPAPALTVNHLLQATPGTRLDWPSLHGQVVVLEFWATWCGPCVADIPVLNSLAASLDPAKVRFISVDDEDPAVIEPFLKKNPIVGWLAFDTTGKVFDAYGVNARPTTIIVGPDGRVATANTHPESLQREQLLALAAGQPVDFDRSTGPGSAAPAALAQRKQMLDKEFNMTAPRPGSAEAAFALTVTSGDKGDTRIMMRDTGQFDITNASPRDLLVLGAGIRSTRLTVKGELTETPYNLHVEAPNLPQAELSRLIEDAISSATGVHIEPKTAVADVYVLEASPGAGEHAAASPYPGGAGYSKKAGKLQAINATLDQFAAALEKALGTPVVDETNLTGKLNLVAALAPNDLAATNALLEKELNLKLVPANRSITTYVVSAAKSTVP